MHTDLLDPSSPAAEAFVTHLHEARAMFDPPGAPEPTAYSLNVLRHRSSRHQERHWVTYDGGEIVASAEAQWWEAPDNRDRAWVALDVTPERYSDEVAAATVAPMVEALRALGRTTLMAEVPAGHPFGEYVETRGGKLGSVERFSVNPLRDLDPGMLAEYAKVPDGYELVTFDGPCPDDLIEPYVRMVETMNTAPRDDLTYEDWVWTPDRIRDFEVGLADRGHRMWTVCARRVGDTEFAGFTNLVVAPEWPDVVQQEDTAVAIPHRGRGLGFTVKATNLLRLVGEHPEARWITTWNAESNSHMLRVNETLGFRAHAHVHAYEIEADALA